MQQESLKIKCLIAQLDCKSAFPSENIKRASVSLSKYKTSDEIDVVLFPEMAFTGYHFKDRSDISRVVEKAGKGENFTFCSNLAKKLNSYVICGYPEITGEGEEKHYYNSAYVINRDGSLLCNYRKHFLYETDKRWAEEGESFCSLELVNTEGKKFKAVVAICMDINPWEFKDSSKFELADFCLKEKMDALFFLSAWKDSEENSNDKKSIERALNYWVYRMYSCITREGGSPVKQWGFFVADRVGKEEDTVFVGCSAALKVNPLRVISCLDKRNEGYLNAEINLE